MTWGFFYLLVLLGGLTLALVSGLARRLLAPSELCDHVTAPSPEHRRGHPAAVGDLAISFITLFGLGAFAAHGLTSFAVPTEIVIGVIAGLVGALGLRVWLCRDREPGRQRLDSGSLARVVRDIPARGYGQVELELAGVPVKLAARSQEDEAIAAGTAVEIVHQLESVVVVSLPREARSG